MKKKTYKYQKSGYCPCSEKCCQEPKTFCPKHVCIEKVCEDCYVTECKNCGSSCSCDL